MPDNCKDILVKGVYETHIQTRTGNLEQDYKHYFSSVEFRRDFRDRKFKYGVDVIVDAGPLKLDLDASDTELNEFQRKVRESTTFSLKESFFEQSVHSIPNKAIVEAWQKCMENNLGFKITNEVIGNYVTFKLRYINFGVASKPKLQKVTVIGGKLESRTLNDNEFINILEDVTFICSFSSETLLISIDTDFTSLSDSASKNNKQKSEDNNPVGTIISSYLNWEEFQKETDNNKYTDNGLFNGEKSFWAPCDGRLVNNSDFYKLTNQTNVPDLRGVFMRGLNSFDRYENDYGINSVSDSQRDPQINRVRGEFQSGAVEKHNHTISQGYGQYWNQHLYDDPGSIINFGQAGAINAISSSYGSEETRPKNRAFYYFIKINK